MTPKQKENAQLVSCGLVVLTMTFTMKWWFAPIIKFAASIYGI